MAFNRFRWGILIRVGLILLLGFAAVLTTQTHFWLVAGWLGLFAALLTGELIRYVERTQRDLGNFLLSIRQGDFTGNYRRRARNLHEELIGQAFQDIMQVFQQLRRERESEHLYLQTIVQHVGVALLCFDAAGEIRLMNEAARQLFRRPYLKNIQNLREVADHAPALTAVLERLPSGQRELVRLVMQGQLMNLSVQATELKLEGEWLKLVSFQDIRSELEAQEVESWQKLIRVLTHEIMNSVIPIATLASVTHQMVEGMVPASPGKTTLDEEETTDLLESLRTIEKRSKGMAHFVEDYRSLTQMPVPVFTDVEVLALFRRVIALHRPRLEAQQVALKLQVTPETLRVTADPELLEQVLINLMLNALDALQAWPSPVLWLVGYVQPNGRVALQVKDNGPGIPPNLLEQVFVPFFTTKKNGSGVGLSLSRQIMRLHRGSLQVQSEPEKGTVVTLHF
ncbi:Histidine kinase-, DNA gyrase B-, and HSP90-like ATPase [Catalinimonas alkaloidigena]|uniref:histidine kinase n=1 Tax=Catalinimonas alkaloidigena TaxID=1075417 RepID=A0A1G9FCT1_9BACT|nr:ATP-binding protein [Catalinimonas alkaloidigena]SDK86157.1 Histidine kinase-, DNA gyrase B-, and HSP90-like ATPase [Catalinimonas alkaloidigena]